ncbi:nuclear transport factor 2 family protein [Kitasatospora sp. NPDC056138]|uniref:nuclear transport factor 2 family protein n=1 Tax=Kitasatospora sp. NPDC056138 TaxID=3345724 RepID=UPI0035DE5A71
MTDTAVQVAAAYFEAWRTKDFAALRELLADDVTFEGPLGRAAGADECLKGLEGMGRLAQDLVVQRMAGAGTDVLTWFDLHTNVTDPFPVTNWSRVENGRITRVRATFDPRALLAALEPRD